MDKNLLIEKYLQGVLSEKEQILFDKLLMDDSSFKNEVSFQKNVKSSVIANDQENFKNLIAKIEKSASRKRKKTLFSKKWLIAASVLFLFSIAFLLQNRQQYNSESLFKENFIPYKNVIYPIHRGVENNPKQDKKLQAFLAYENGDYQKAVFLFSDLYQQTNESYYLFYKANALLQLNKPNEAIPLLQSHIQTQDTLKDKSKWYLALAYLKARNTKKAKNLLNNIVSKKTYNYKKAKKIIKNLPK